MGKAKNTCGKCALYNALKLFPQKLSWCKKDSKGRKGINADSPACMNFNKG